MERSLERNSMTRPEMERFIEKTDKYRGDFYRYYTGHQWAGREKLRPVPEQRKTWL